MTDAYFQGFFFFSLLVFLLTPKIYSKLYSLFFLTFQKIIYTKVWRTYLYLCYGTIMPEEVAEVTSVYFLRNTEGMVPLPNTMSEANAELPKCFEVGILNGHALNMLEQIITQVWLHNICQSLSTFTFPIVILLVNFMDFD